MALGNLTNVDRTGNSALFLVWPQPKVADTVYAILSPRISHFNKAGCLFVKMASSKTQLNLHTLIFNYWSSDVYMLRRFCVGELIMVEY